MNRNREDWTEAVRRSLDGAEQPLPMGGWERLEREMEGLTPSAPGVQSRKIWIKFAAAAAAVLVCVSIGVRVGLNDKNVLEKRVVTVSEAAVSGQNTEREEIVSSRSGDIAVLGESAPKADSHGADIYFRVEKSVGRGGAQSMEGAPHLAEEATSDSESITEAPKELQSVDSLESRELFSDDSGEMHEEHAVLPAAVGESSSPAAQSRYATADYDGLFAEAQPHASHKGGSVGFSAGGIVTSAGGGQGMVSSTMLMSDDPVSLLNAYDEYSYDHKQPLSFGLTFRKELGRGFSLESGLVYTLLRSTVTIPGAAQDVRQRLHMLGIPLRVNWEFLHYGNFSLYVGAGGMAEKCVSARFGSESVKERGLQWSLFGAVGAQYKLGKLVGLYFEPEISYYLTETSLRTSYTDSTVGLNLQFGLRFTY